RLSSGNDQSSDVAVGDVDGDGDLDLVFANVAQTKSLYLNDGSGVFTDESDHLPQTVRLSTSVAMGDVDGGGDLDLVFGNTWDAPYYLATVSARNELYLNEGGSFFANASGRLPNENDFTGDVVLGDFDGDGDLDLIAANADDDPALFPNSHTKLYFNN